MVLSTKAAAAATASALALAASPKAVSGASTTPAVALARAAPAAYWPSAVPAACGVAVADAGASRAHGGTAAECGEPVVAEVEVPYAAELNAAEFSVSAWVRLAEKPGVGSHDVVRSSSSASGAASADDAMTAGYKLALQCAPSEGPSDATDCTWDFSVVAADAEGTKAVFAASTGAASPGGWAHVTGVLSQGAAKVYVTDLLNSNATISTVASKDEVPLVSAGVNGNSNLANTFAFLPNAEADLVIGDASLGVDSVVAEVAYFDYGLSDSQVQAIAAAAPADAAPNGDAVTLVGDSLSSPVLIALSDAQGAAVLFSDTRDTRGYTDAFNFGGCEFADDKSTHSSPDVVYALTAFSDMLARVVVCSTGDAAAGVPAFDLVIYVLKDAASNPNADVLGCSDDAANTPPECPSGSAAVVSAVPIAAGETVHIVVDGFGVGEAGLYSLTVAELAEVSSPGVPFVGAASSIAADGAVNPQSFAQRNARATLTSQAFEPVHTGDAAIRADMGEYGAVRLRATNLDGFISARAIVGFWIRSDPTFNTVTDNTPTPPIALVLAGDGADAPAPVQSQLTVLQVAPDEWTYVKVDLAQHIEASSLPAASAHARYKLISFVSFTEIDLPFLIDDVVAFEPAAAPLASSPNNLMASPTDSDVACVAKGAGPAGVAGCMYATALAFGDSLASKHFTVDGTDGVTVALTPPTTPDSPTAHSGERALSATDMQPGASVVFTPTAAYGNGDGAMPLAGYVLLWVRADPSDLAKIAVSINSIKQPLTTYMTGTTDDATGFQLASIPLANFRVASQVASGAVGSVSAFALSNAAASGPISLMLDDVVLAARAPQPAYDLDAVAAQAPVPQREVFEVARVLYGDSLTAGWEDASWSASVDYDSSALTSSGSAAAIAIDTSAPHGAWSIATKEDGVGFGVKEGIAALEMDVFMAGEGADGGLTVELIARSTGMLEDPVGEATAALSSGRIALPAALVDTAYLDPAFVESGWKRVHVDLREVNPTASWTNIVLQSATPRSLAVDNVQLMAAAGTAPDVPAGPTPTLPPVVESDDEALVPDNNGTDTGGDADEPSDGGGLSTGAIVGIVVGCLAGLAVVVAIAAVAYKRGATAAAARGGMVDGAGPSNV